MGAPYWERVDGPAGLVRWGPAVLLAASLTCALVAQMPHTAAGYGKLLLLSVAAVLLNWWWMSRTGLSVMACWAFFVGGLALTAAMIAISPFYGIYGFLGYTTGMLLFDGFAQVLALGANALVMAASQVGGFPQVPRAVPGFLALALINCGVVTIIVRFGQRRAEEVNERERSAQELARISQRNQDLQEQLLRQAHERGTLQERERLSREIHDTVAQDLVAIVSQLEAIDPQGDWPSRVESAKELARDGLAEARRAVSALRSPLLDDATAADAVEGLLDTWSERHGIDARLEVAGSPVRTGQDQVVVRVAQEALSNVARHSGAQQVVIRLAYTQDGLLMRIRDDGKGFATSAVEPGFGLRNMRERIEAAGGSFDVESTEGAGCLIDIAAPA